MDTQLDIERFATTSHSSIVQMYLHIGSDKLPVLQSSESAIKLNESDSVPQGDAILEIIVDGRSRTWPIRILPESPWPNWIGIADRD